MPDRVIKASVRTSPNFNQLDDAAEILFYRSLTLADDHGCFEASPDTLRGQLFPKKLKQWPLKKIINSLVSLANNQLIILWTKEARLYGKFVTFSSHQRVRSLHNRKTPKPPTRLNLVAVNNYLGSFDVNCQQVADNCRQVSSIGGLKPKPKPKPNLNPNLNLKHKPKPQSQTTIQSTKLVQPENQKSVEVLKLAFLKKFHSNPFPFYDNDNYRKKTFNELNNTLLSLIDRVKNNIDIFIEDMDTVAKDNSHSVGTLLYFITSQHGASRWDKMADEFTFAEHAKLKQEWIEALDHDKRMRQLSECLSSRDQPDYIEKAIKEFKKLVRKYELEQNPTERDLLRNQILSYQQRFGFG